MNSIGKKITQLRTEMGYTQKQLAKLANITELHYRDMKTAFANQRLTHL